MGKPPQRTPPIEPEYTPTIDGDYIFDYRLGEPSIWFALYKSYLEQKRRALITELRALDKLLGRKQTIPRKER